MDAGMIAPAETIRIPLDEWLSASTEELDSLRDLPLHTNQQYLVERELMTGDTLIRVRYGVPCITTLEKT